MIRQIMSTTVMILALNGAANAQDAATASASFLNADGQANGSAELTGMAAGGVLIKLEVTGLPANQWVAFHVHETGSCDHETNHESAGGHFNPAPRSTATGLAMDLMLATCPTSMSVRTVHCALRSSTRWSRSTTVRMASRGARSWCTRRQTTTRASRQATPVIDWPAQSLNRRDIAPYSTLGAAETALPEVFDDAAPKIRSETDRQIRSKSP